MTDAGLSAPQGPVTVVARRRVRAGREAEYEAWLTRLQEAARDLPGYLGAEVQRPGPGTRDYVSVFRFDMLENLEAFEVSDLRRDAMAEVAPLSEADAVWDRTTGFEVWFDPPAGTVVAQPVRWRMASMLVVVIFALVLTIGTLVGWLVPSWPYPLRLLVTIAVEVALLTYVIMPPLTRAMSWWIYPRGRVA
jgi:antibiotic biosynthesis monooxygenase (ABM) superfamily enzyme